LIRQVQRLGYATIGVGLRGDARYFRDTPAATRRRVGAGGPSDAQVAFPPAVPRSVEGDDGRWSGLTPASQPPIAGNSFRRSGTLPSTR